MPPQLDKCHPSILHTLAFNRVWTQTNWFWVKHGMDSGLFGSQSQAHTDIGYHAFTLTLAPKWTILSHVHVFEMWKKVKVLVPNNSTQCWSRDSMPIPSDYEAVVPTTVSQCDLLSKRPTPSKSNSHFLCQIPWRWHIIIIRHLCFLYKINSTFCWAGGTYS